MAMNFDVSGLKKGLAEMKKAGLKQTAKDFWYGKPHTADEGGRRIGELFEDKTGLYKHREWRGVKDTMYYFYMIWGYNYVNMVLDIMKYGISRGELRSVCQAVGMDSVVNPEDQDYPLYQYLASDDARFEKLLEIPEMLRTPIVRNGKKATVGYCPDVWKDWD